ncbi:hypothetical protein Tco_1284460 [Tanacetum coccineum]
MHIFVKNFDFMIVEDISSVIDPRLSQVVLGKPFVEISNMTHDLSLGIVRFANGTGEIAYKMPHKIEQFNSLTDLGKEHTKSVYFRNIEDKRRGVEYVMNKILGFYKECLELGPEYLTGLEEEEEVDINKKTENQAKMTKLSMEWKRLCRIKAKVRVNTEESAVKPEPELKNTIGCNLNPSDGPGKPNSITMKTVKTKWALNQFQQPICVQLTKTVKTLKAQS